MKAKSFRMIRRVIEILNTQTNILSKKVTLPIKKSIIKLISNPSERNMHKLIVLNNFFIVELH